jgi:hypothetical protein
LQLTPISTYDNTFSPGLQLQTVDLTHTGNSPAFASGFGAQAATKFMN